MDKKIFLDWFTSVFFPEVDQNSNKSGRPQKPKCMLLLIIVQKTKMYTYIYLYIYICCVWSEVTYLDQVYETSMGFMLIIHKGLQRREISF